jgi:hypothetical protein
MHRSSRLLALIAVLLVANAGYHWWRGRGLITIHCEDWPAAKVIREIERQSGITLKSSVPADTKIRLHVDKAPVAEALETLATVAEARWRLAYVFAPSRSEIQTALAAFVAGEKPEQWKQTYFPMPPMSEEDNGLPPDPRADPWLVEAVEKPEFQSFVEQASRKVSAVFYYPEAWNPPVSKAPAKGPITKSAPALAKAAGGQVREVFLLEKRGRDFAGGPPEDGERDRGRGPRFPFAGGNGADRDRMRQAFTERAQAEIDKLPPEKRAAAQAQFDERRKFFESMRDLPPEQRREKMQEFMQRDDIQDRIEQRMSERIARMTPDQRVQRAQNYVNRKQAARNK